MKPINTYIIPVLNNVDGLIKLVNSLYKYTPPNFRIIVIFNGRDEDYITLKLLLNDKVHLWVQGNRNFGFGKSMNMGIRLADTEYVTIANDDVEVLYPTWWDEIMEIFKENPNLMGFNPHSFINKAASGDRVAEYEIKDEYTMEDIDKMKAFFPKWYVGCCTYFTICKKQLFDEIGLFDESFGQGSGEDYDLMVRAGKKGYIIGGGSRVMVKHWWGGTKDNLPKTPEFTSNFNMIVKGNERLTEKWGFHIDEVNRRTYYLHPNLEDPNHETRLAYQPRMTQEEADAIHGGWSVSGQGGADEPLDKGKINYEKDGWYVIEEL